MYGSGLDFVKQQSTDFHGQFDMCGKEIYVIINYIGMHKNIYVVLQITTINYSLLA